MARAKRGFILPILKGYFDFRGRDYVTLFGLLDKSFQKTWFRIGHQGDRFLHPGQESAGCITVKIDDQHKDWGTLYSSIILARKDSYNIGIIEIVQ